LHSVFDLDSESDFEFEFELEIELIKGRSIPEPQYETETYYAVTAYGNSLDVAAKKATGYMIDHLVQGNGCPGKMPT
jgi:acetamidase/formamidase